MKYITEECIYIVLAQATVHDLNLLRYNHKYNKRQFREVNLEQRIGSIQFTDYNFYMKLKSSVSKNINEPEGDT